MLVVLGLLVPVVYAATRNDHGSEILSSASVEPAVEEEKTQDEVQKNQRQDLEEQDADTVDGKRSSQSLREQRCPIRKVRVVRINRKANLQGSQAVPAREIRRVLLQVIPLLQRKKTMDQRLVMFGVTVTIVGKNGNIMYNSAKVDVKENGSVLDALYASGVSCKVTSDGYVEEISGLAEKSTGEGWMYSVNGGAPPGVGAGSYTVSSGDRIIWYYGSFMDPPPKL